MARWAKAVRALVQMSDIVEKGTWWMSEPAEGSIAYIAEKWLTTTSLLGWTLRTPQLHPASNAPYLKPFCAPWPSALHRLRCTIRFGRTSRGAGAGGCRRASRLLLLLKKAMLRPPAPYLHPFISPLYPFRNRTVCIFMDEQARILAHLLKALIRIPPEQSPKMTIFRGGTPDGDGG